MLSTSLLLRFSPSALGREFCPHGSLDDLRKGPEDWLVSAGFVAVSE